MIYAGIWQSPEAVAQAVLDEDADWLGLSLLNGAHLTLVPRVLEALRFVGAEQVRCLIGGIRDENRRCNCSVLRMAVSRPVSGMMMTNSSPP